MICVVGLLSLLAPGHVQAQATLDIEQEFEFASELVNMGFSDLANRVVQHVLRLHPDQKDRATRIQGEILVAQRKFAEAEALSESMPKNHAQTYALRLKIANGYFRANETDKAKAIYDEFFAIYKDKIPAEKDLLRFYQEAAYQYGQMLERLGDRAGAAKAYTRLLSAKLDDPDAVRKLQIDLAQLNLRLGREAQGSERTTYLNAARKLCDDVLWGGYDVWFGRAIAIMANIELARNNEAGARKLLAEYMKDLSQIDNILKEQDFPMSLSPMADARFLLGELLEKQVNAARARNAPETEVLPLIQQALTEYYNVFAKYGDSEWAGDAGTRARALVEMLDKEYGRKINLDLGSHKDSISAAQFKLADDLFRQKLYDRAVEEYLRILTAYPESEASLRALANVLISYANLNEPLFVKATAGYIAERFAGQELPANALLVAGRIYLDRKDEAMYMAIFDDYFKGFPEHSRAPALLYDLARLREQAGDRESATKYYKQIYEKYPEDRLALIALFSLGWDAHQVEDYETAISYFKQYIEVSRPGHDRVRVQFLMADAQQRLKHYAEAIQSYGQIVRWLSVKNPPDNARPEDVPKNEDLLEKSLFFIGFCFGRITEPADQVPVFRQRALTMYDQYLKQYPKSELAPKAMRHKGAIQLELGLSKEAAATFDQLAREFPNSEEGKSALFALVSSALEIGKVDIARDAFRKMIASPDSFSTEEFTRIGQLMLDNHQYDEVIPAYKRVVETTDKRPLLELALYGLGYAYRNVGKQEEAVNALQDLMTRFPNSGYFYEAKFLTSAALRDLGRYPEAIAPLSEILRYSQDNLINQRAQYELGIIQALGGDKPAALATYQRIALLQDPKNPTLRPIIDNSLFQGAQLAMELERFEDVETICAQYLNDFPQGQHVEDMRRIRAEARMKAIQ